MNGYVYVLSNPCMPGLVKIGRSIHSGCKRARDIDQTGVPAPFVVEWEMLVDDPVYLEAASHDRLKEQRVSSSREFFKVEVSTAIEAIIDEYAITFDMGLRDLDWILDESYILNFTHRLNDSGENIIGPEVSYALAGLDIEIVRDTVYQWREFVAKAKKERLNTETKSEDVSNG